MCEVTSWEESENRQIFTKIAGRFFLRYDTLTRYDTLCVVNSKLLKIRYENSIYAMRFLKKFYLRYENSEKVLFTLWVSIRQIMKNSIYAMRSKWPVTLKRKPPAEINPCAHMARSRGRQRWNLIKIKMVLQYCLILSWNDFTIFFITAWSRLMLLCR